MVAVQDPPARPSASGTSRAPGARVPALDGLRGFALIGMLLWHAEVTWVQGGFARMTIFFALSGYLATLSWERVRERQGGRGGFGAFWWRRARRLLPVSFLGVGFAIAVTVLTGTAGMRERLGGDVLSVLGYVSNLRFWLSEQSYGELFGEPSLLQHYWTLSIEEQAFILLPLLLAGVGLVCRRSSRSAALVVAAIAVVCAGLPAVVHHSPDGVWYSSIVRFGEFSAGVALALWLSASKDRVRRVPDWVLPAAGTASLAVLVMTMLFVPRDAGWLYRGGMALFIVPTLVCLAAAAASAGSGARLLGSGPLVRLGRWTFSVYVLHWPLFWLLDTSSTGMHGWELAAVRLTAAIALGAVVHGLVERPLMAPGPGAAAPGPSLVTLLDRASRWWVPAAWWRTRPAMTALVLAGGGLIAVTVTLPNADPPYGYHVAQELPGAVGDAAPAYGDPVPNDLSDRGPLDEDAVRIASMRLFEPSEGRISVGLFGSSVAGVLDNGGRHWLAASEDLAPRPGATRYGCGLVTEGERVVGFATQAGGATIGRPAEVCGRWRATWPHVADLGNTQVALVVLGTWDAYEFDLDGAGPAHAGLPAFDELYRTHLDTMLAGFREAGVVQVQLATSAPQGKGADGRQWERRGLDESHLDRVAGLNAVLREFAADHVDVVVIELADYVESLDPDERAEMMPDGLHYSDEGADRAWREFLGAAVVAAYDARP